MDKLFFYVQGAVAIIITFGLAVFVHEFGHMIFALLRGVPVESFAMGMGPKITSWKWRGIDFSLRWFPVGGFVKLGGKKDAAEANPVIETPKGTASADEVALPETGAAPAEGKTLSESSYDDLYALQDKGLVTKLLVFGGGVFMNFVTAVAALALLLWIGQDMDQNVFQLDRLSPTAAPDVIVARTGLQAGDKVVAFNGTPIKFDTDFQEALIKAIDAGKAKDKDGRIHFTLTVERAGATGGKQNINIGPLTSEQMDQWLTGVLKNLRIPALVGAVVPTGPADNAGVKQGDRIVAVDGQPVHSFLELKSRVQGQLGKPVTLAVDRKGEKITLTMTPTQSLDDAKQGQIGIFPGSEYKTKKRIANPLEALSEAPGMAWERVKFFTKMQADFFRKASFKQVRENVGGPIAIAAITAKAAQGGFSKSLDWFINLNLLLMIFNLLPLPVLDGGFIVLGFIEAIIRRPVPPKVLGPVYTVFVIGFILLIVLISVQDVVRWVPKLIH